MSGPRTEARCPRRAARFGLLGQDSEQFRSVINLAARALGLTITRDFLLCCSRCCCLLLTPGCRGCADHFSNGLTLNVRIRVAAQRSSPQWCAAGDSAKLNGIFRTRHAPDLFCDRNTTLDDFLEARVLLLHNCPNFSSQNRTGHREQQMRESLESQIPDTTPYIEWLAIVCSIVVAALFCAVLFSNGALT